MDGSAEVDELARLAELDAYRILDTDPEDAFDDLTRAAAEVAGVPTALVSLVASDRQWFKSRQLLDVCETERDVALCDHVVRARKELVIPNTLEDERFRDNPLVTGSLGIRFYAGFPLRVASGHVLGTLCVIGYEPGNLTESQLSILRVLAKQVVAQLELRRKLAELEATQSSERAFTLLQERALADSASASVEIARAHRDLTDALDAMPRAVTLADVDRDENGNAIGLRVRWVNVWVTKLMKRPLEDMVGKPLADVYPDFAPLYEKTFLDVAVTGIPLYLQSEPFSSQYVQGAFDFTVVPWSDDGLLVDTVDVTDRYVAERAVQLSERRLRAAQDAAGLGAWDWDLITGAITWSPLMYQLLGVPEDTELVPDLLTRMMPQEDQEAFTVQWQECLTSRATTLIEFRIVRPAGDVANIRTWVTTEHDDNGVPVRVSGTNQDITATRTREQELLVEANTDALTGLDNRRAWEQGLLAAIDPVLAGTARLIVAILDLDHFKVFNDTFGHPVGDALLRDVAAIWRAHLAVQAPLARLARIGGEEFAITMPDSDVAGARQLLLELCAKVPRGQTASAGITEANADDDSRSLMARADAALYAAKHSGRNRVEALTRG